MEDKLCLEGDLAQPFMSHKVGDRIPIKLDAVLVAVGMRPDYTDAAPGGSKKPPTKPYVEFVLRSVNGKSENPKEETDTGAEPDYANMASGEFEKTVAKNKGYDGNG